MIVTTAPGDFTALVNSVVTFPPSSPSGTEIPVPVTIINDGDIEPEMEQFILRATSTSNVAQPPQTDATGVIRDDDGRFNTVHKHVVTDCLYTVIIEHCMC